MSAPLPPHEEQRLQFEAHLLDTIEHSVIATDLEETITYWNRYAEKLFGWAAAEAVGRKASEVLVPSGLRGNGAEIIEKVLAGEVWSGEFVVQRRDGSTFPVQVTDSPIRAANGAIIGIVGIAHDITDRKRDEEALRESQQAIRLTLEAAQIGHWDLDLVTHTATRSLRHDQIFGYEELLADWSYERFLTHVHPEDREEVDRLFQAGVAAKTKWEFECRITRHDGALRWIWAHGNVFTNAAGEATRMLGMVNDITERKCAERQLRESEAKYRQLLSSNIIGVIFWNVHGDILDANDLFLEMVGFTREDLREGKLSWKKLTPPEYAPLDEKGLGELAATGTCAPFEKEYIRKDGSRVSVLLGAALLEGQEDTGVCFVMDVTQRKEAEDALRESAERFRSYFELGLIGMALTSPTKSWIEVNDEFCRIMGYERSELLRMTWAELTHPDDLAVDVAHFNRVLAGEIDGYSMEKRFIRKDGQVIDATISVKCLRHADGSVDYFVALVQDITERKLAEEALRESEQQVRLFMEATADCLWNWDMITGDVARNAGFARAFGYTAQEVGSSVTWWEERLHPDDREKILSTFQKTSASGGKACSYEYRFRRKDGTHAVIHDRACIVRDAKGKPVRALGAMTDITERKQAERQIEHFADLFQTLSHRLLHIQEEERRHLARELHDEIGQTLTAAKLNLKIIAPDVAAAAAGRLEDSIELLDRLLQQVRQLSLDLRPPLLDELGLVPTLRWLADQQAQRAGLRVTFTANVEGLEMDPPLRTACFRVVQEAITNAIRHARAGTVAVELRADPDRVRLVVQDDGVGFDYEARQQRAARGASVGLLSMSERVSLLGGEFEVNSAPGRGTEIRAWFPLAPPVPDGIP